MRTGNSSLRGAVSRLAPVLGPLLGSVLMAWALFAVLLQAPMERTMGPVQKIFYFHLGSALAAFTGFAAVLFFSILFLVFRRSVHDLAALAAAEVGVLFCSLVLLTGPLWARPVWGRWWMWDPRLTTTLVLWFLYAGYLLLRRAVPGYKGSLAAAAYGVLAFVDVPIVYFSVRWWRGIHPQVIQGGEIGIDPGMRPALVLSLLAFLALAALLFRERWRLALADQRAHGLEQAREV